MFLFTNRQIKIKNFSIICYCLILLISKSIFSVRTVSNIIFFILIFPLGAYSLIKNLKNKHVFFGLINVLNLELGFAMFMYLYIIKAEVVGWRSKFAAEKYTNLAFHYFLISECILLLMYFMFMPKNRKNVLKYRLITFNASIEIRIFIIFALVFFILKVNILEARNYTENFDNFAGVFFSYGSVLSCIVFNRMKRDGEKIFFDSIIFSLYALISFVLAIKGYRTYFVALVFSYIAIQIVIGDSMDYKIILKLLIVGILVYAFLIVAKGVYKGLPASSYICSHESSIFFSLAAMIRNTKISGTDNAYLNALHSLLPSFITHKDNMNSGAFMMQYVDANSYRNTQISIGTYFLAEGYLSYGKIGIPIISAIYSAIAIIMDKLKNNFQKNTLLFCLYIYMISQLYNAVYYGAYTFIKYVLYFAGLLVLFNWKAFFIGNPIRYTINRGHIK